MPTYLKFLTTFILLLIGQQAIAQAELDEREVLEQARQQAFSDGMSAIIGNLNAGSFKLFTKAIDKDDFIDRIFGLRLIDGGIKRDFRSDIKESEKWSGFVKSLYAKESEDGIRATLLIVESRGESGRAVVRFDMSRFRANYHEYDLRLDDKGRVIIVDWNDYLWGHLFTDRMGLTMVQAKPNKNAARKLVDFSNVREEQIFQIMELLKATRDRDFDRYAQIMETLDERLKAQRTIIKLGLDTARAARKRGVQRDSLQMVDRYFATDPLFALALMDYYLPAKRYQDAYDALLNLQRYLRIDDALLNARLSSILLVMNRIDDATELALKSVTQEPDLELGWWSVIRARVTAKKYADAIEALETLERDFGQALGPDALSKDPLFRDFMLSAEYRGWFEGSG